MVYKAHLIKAKGPKETSTQNVAVKILKGLNMQFFLLLE